MLCHVTLFVSHDFTTSRWWGEGGGGGVGIAGKGWDFEKLLTLLMNFPVVRN